MIADGDTRSDNFFKFCVKPDRKIEPFFQRELRDIMDGWKRARISPYSSETDKIKNSVSSKFLDFRQALLHLWTMQYPIAEQNEIPKPYYV